MDPIYISKKSLRIHFFQIGEGKNDGNRKIAKVVIIFLSSLSNVAYSRPE